MLDLNKIKTYYNFTEELQLADIELLVKNCSIKNYFENDLINDVNNKNAKIYFLQNGLVRKYCINQKGEEITTAIFTDNQIFANEEVIFSNQPSKYAFQSIEKSTLFTISYQKFEQIISENVKLNKNRKFVTRKILLKLSNRLETFLLLKPEERYIKFVAENMAIINRIPDKYIANILGITAVSLSRIKKRIHTKS